MLVISEDEMSYFKQLDERQQRLYLGLKAKLLGRSGVRQVSQAFAVHANTVRKGKSELPFLTASPPKRVRKVGGGPKKK
jgi:hypothetical protein